MRICFTSIVLGSVLSLSAAATPATVPAAQLDLLTMPVGKMHFEATPLKYVIETIRKRTGQNIFVNWRELDRVHIDADLPVTIDLSNLPLGDALARLLDNIGGEYALLGYRMENGQVINIATRAHLADTGTVLYMLDVRPALTRYPDNGPNSPRQAAVDRMIARIEGIDPLSWRDHGGPGSITELSGMLIITQTPEIQQRIIHELKDILPDLKPQTVQPGMPATGPSPITHFGSAGK